MSHKKHVLLAILSLSITPVIAGPGANGAFGAKRAVVFGIDGCRSDALKLAVENGSAPNIAALIADGSVTWNAYAGGDLGTATQQATSSGPGWASILTGVWVDKHGVANNSFSGQQFGSYPHFMRRLHDLSPAADLGSVVHWEPIDGQIVQNSRDGSNEFLSYRKVVTSDASVASETISHVSSADPEVMFLHFDDLDHAGHASGYSTGNPAYMSTIATIDGQIGDVVNAVKARPQYAQEDWLIIITTDHGGNGTSHGGQSSAERTIPFIASGGDMPKGSVTRESIGHLAVPATVFRHLGLGVPAAWGWESDAFKIGAEMHASVGAQSVFLSWSLPAGGIAGLTGFELRRDGVLVATLAPNVRNFTDVPAGEAGEGVNYELTLVGSVEAALKASTLVPGVPEDVTDPVLHLTFDGSLADASGRGNNAAAEGAAAYVTGKQGQALQLDATHTARIGDTVNGAPDDLRFGANKDFTVSFWFRAPNAWTSDPAILSNKNWNNGANQGWAIAAEGSGNDWQWNFKGDLLGRKDFDPSTANILGTDWHLVTVTHDRDGDAVFYHDGVEIGRNSIAGAGDVDTGFPLRIGADGNFGNLWNTQVEIDELKIWRRALGANEVAVEAGIAATGPVLHLTFDGTLADASGRANDADAEGGTTYVAGKIGQALQLSNSQTARLGTVGTGAPADLKFGASTDFTVSFWFRAPNGWSSDPSILSNKDWNNGANQGWIVAAGVNDGWQWNFKGSAVARKDFDPSDASIDGTSWRLVSVTHDRDGDAVFYHDGAEIGRVSIAGAGDVDTALPVRIGADGNFGNKWNTAAEIDDLKVWRRVLSPAEIAAEAGVALPTEYGEWMADQAELYAYQGGELGEGDDADADGWNNLLEFSAGTSPFTGSEHPTWQVAQAPGGGLRLRFCQRNGGFGVHGVDDAYRADGLAYSLEVTDDLAGPWLAPNSDAVQVDAASTAGRPGTNTHEIVVDIAPAGAKRFCRLKVEVDAP